MELKDPVSIKLQFVFNAGNPWSRLFDFEKDLSDFLSRRDMVGEVVNSINGQQGEMLVFVRQKTMEEKALPNQKQPQPVPPQTKPSTQIRELKKELK